MKTLKYAITATLLLGHLVPTDVYARKASRKLEQDSSVKKDMVPVTTYVQPGIPSGIASNSYVPAPQAVTTYAYQAPAAPPQQDMTPMLMQGLMQLFSSMKGMGGTTAPAKDTTAAMPEAELNAQTYTQATPDSVADLNATATNDDAEVQVPGGPPSRTLKNGNLHSMKREGNALGQCIAPVTTIGDAKKILVRNGVKVGQETNERQLISLAMGIQQIELLSGGRAKYVNGATFRFLKNSRYSSQRPNGIYMGANHVDGNVSHLMHELGHYVGNAGLYDGYKKLGHCNPTNYSHKNYSDATARNEEFAEVFAAFVASPQNLSESKDKNCQDAFKYLSAAFPKAGEFAICNRPALVAAVQNKGTQTAALETQPSRAVNAVQ